ncbi:hypothetical protein F6Y03_10940 [Bacillus megaterium]|nr:hypothetical protein [Priestia megaterium]
MDIKNTLTLLGVIATFFVGIWNLKLAKGNRFTSSINVERLKWINNIREVFSQFNKNCHMYADAVLGMQYNNGAQVTEEDIKRAEHIFYEILYYLDLIKLYTNPTELLSHKLYLAMKEMKSELSDESFNKDRFEDIKDNIHYYQQVILKAEWKRMKKEARLGRELGEEEMKEIFISTSSDIDNERYFKFLKEGFENQNSE